MNEPLSCRLECFSSTPHLGQIYAGFGRLQRAGRLRVRLVRRADYKPSGMHFLFADIAGKRVFYDLEDHEIINRAHLDDCDFYFKRSFDPRVHPSVDARIRPLGLNYAVNDADDFFGRRALWDALALRRSNDAAELARKIFDRRLLRVESFESAPRESAGGGVLFMVRLWEPARVRDEKLREERVAINTMRAECVRRLRAEFGPLFTGGIARSDFAAELYPDLIADDRATGKRRYLDAVRRADVCVATMGLRRSNGWKFGEYVAGAKAIVAERLRYEPPGDFREGRNYLAFDDADQCVAAVRRLMDDAPLRLAMRRANAAYYRGFLTPEALVANSLSDAIGRLP